MKTLIVYYSLEGNTKLVSEYIAGKIGADLLAIQPINEIAKTGFMRYLWGGRQAIMKELPPLQSIDRDWREYDFILIGTPVWGFTMSPPIRSFLTMHPISGKKVAFFALHEGAPGKTITSLQSVIPENTCIGTIDIRSPKRFGTEEAFLKIDAWLKSMGLGFVKK